MCRDGTAEELDWDSAGKEYENHNGHLKLE